MSLVSFNLLTQASAMAFDIVRIPICDPEENMQANSIKRSVRRPTNVGYWSLSGGNYAIRDKIEILRRLLGFISTVYAAIILTLT
jgi:hypothetical protein